MRRRAAALAAVAALALAGCGGGGDATPTATIVDADAGSAGTATVAAMLRPDPPMRVGDAAMPDVAPGADGRSEPFRAEKGGLLLVFFGYTYCPDVCPTTLSNVKHALDLLGPAKAGKVQVAMVSVDPKRDTAAVLNAYLARLFTGYRALRTDDAATLAAAEKAFAASHRIVGDPSTTTYSVDHTAALYAVDDAGTVKGIWGYGTTPEQLDSDIGTLIA